MLLGASEARILLSLLPEDLEEITIPENEKIVLIEIDKIPKAEFIGIEDIRRNPNEFAGKIIAFCSVGEGINVSTKFWKGLQKLWRKQELW